MFLIFKNRDKENLKRLSDESLVEAFAKSGNNIYFNEIFNRYTHLVFGVCLKYLQNEDDAKDAVMQIFENLITGIDELKIKNFKSWIFTVAKNHCLMKLRKEKSVAKNLDNYRLLSEEKIVKLLQEIHHFSGNNGYDIYDELEKAVKKLKDKQRICIELLYLQNKSYSDISITTGYSVKQVKSFVQNGKRNIKNYLEKNGKLNK